MGSPLEVALTILVILWTIIFLVIAIAIVMLVVALKKAIDKVNRILEQGEDMARGFGAVGKVTAGSLAGLLVKAVADWLKKNSSKRN